MFECPKCGATNYPMLGKESLGCQCCGYMGGTIKISDTTTPINGKSYVTYHVKQEDK
jgi:hypothetical protein